MSKIIAFLLLVACAIPVYADDNGCGVPGDGDTCESGCYFVPGVGPKPSACSRCTNGPGENGNNASNIGCDDNNNCHNTGSGTENDPNSCPWEMNTENSQCQPNAVIMNITTHNLTDVSHVPIIHLRGPAVVFWGE